MEHAALKDNIVINFENVNISVYNDHHNIYRDDENRLTVNFK